MNRTASICALTAFLAVVFAFSASGVPLTGSGTLPFPGATGVPIRDTYLATGPGSGPFLGTWPNGSPQALPLWWGTFAATGPMPHTPPTGSPVTGTALYDFTVATYMSANFELPVGTYFEFGDLDSGSGGGETFQLRAFDASGLILTPWLDQPFAASASAVASDMPNYSYAAGVYNFDGNSVPGNPTIGVFLKNNSAIEMLEVTRTSTFASFILSAPVPEPSSLVLLGCGLAGVAGYARRVRRR